MDSLSYYYSALFDESKIFEKRRLFFHIGILVSAAVAVFAKGYFLYLIGVLGILAQIGFILSKYFSDRSQFLAHDLQRISMINEAFGNDGHRFDISQTIGRMSVRAHKIAKTKSEAKDESTKYNPPEVKDAVAKLKFMIQENAYWNHHLYSVCSMRSWIIFYSVLGGIIILILLIVSFKPTIVNDPAYSFLRLGLIFLGFLRFLEELEKALTWKNTSETMLSIDNNLHSQKKASEESVILVFSDYHVSKGKTPPIPKKVFDKHFEKLHNGWESRKEEILK